MLKNIDALTNTAFYILLNFNFNNYQIAQKINEIIQIVRYESIKFNQILELCNNTLQTLVKSVEQIRVRPLNF